VCGGEILTRETDFVSLADRPIRRGLKAQRAVVIPGPLPGDRGADVDAGLLGVDGMAGAFERRGGCGESDHQRIRRARRFAGIAGESGGGDREFRQHWLRPVYIPAPAEDAGDNDRRDRADDQRRAARVGPH
jgi:hypothetical protein